MRKTAGVAALKNQNSVEMALPATGHGVRLSLAQGVVYVEAQALETCSASPKH